jgi:vancomycin resistance protein YoaR
MTTKKTAAATVKPAMKKAPVEKAPAEAAVKKPKKEHKEKVVRDSFTMPQSEYQKIAAIKETCLKAGLPVKKSEVLRAGLKALVEMNAAQLKRALAGLEKIKTGRPKKP